MRFCPLWRCLRTYPRKASAGQVGTIADVLAPGVYEVEFSDDDGQTYASLAFRAAQLLQLRHQPDHQAA